MLQNPHDMYPNALRPSGKPPPTLSAVASYRLRCVKLQPKCPDPLSDRQGKRAIAELNAKLDSYLIFHLCTLPMHGSNLKHHHSQTQGLLKTEIIKTANCSPLPRRMRFIRKAQIRVVPGSLVAQEWHMCACPV